MLANCFFGAAGSGPPLPADEPQLRSAGETLRELLRGFGLASSTASVLATTIQVALALLLALVLARVLVDFVVRRWLRPLAARTASPFDDALLRLCEKPLRWVIRVLGLYLAIAVIPLESQLLRFVLGVLYVVAALVTTVTAVRVATLLLSTWPRLRDPDDDKRLARDYLPLLRTVVSVALFGVGMIVVMNHFDKDVSSVVAALGVTTLAVGLAAKETLGNMIAGFVLLVDRPFRPGDRVRLQSGETGEVIDIGIRSTRIRLDDSNLLVAPNNEMVGTRVVNLSSPASRVRVEVQVQVPAEVSLTAARELLAEVAGAQPDALAEPAPRVFIQALPDHLTGGTVTVQLFVASREQAQSVQEQLREQAYLRLRELRASLGTSGT